MRWRWMIGVLTLCTSFAVRADDSALLDIRSLYPAEAWVPGQLLPFRVSGTVPAHGRFRSANITSNAGQDCRVMRDPFRADIYLLKCAQPETLTIEFAFELDGNIYRRSVGPVTVQKPGEEFVIDGGGNDDLNALAGQQLFSSHCASCHNPPTSKARKSASTISAAIQNNSMMRNVPTLRALTAEEIDQIATYLGGLR